MLYAKLQLHKVVAISKNVVIAAIKYLMNSTKQKIKSTVFSLYTT